MRASTGSRISWRWYAVIGALLPGCFVNASPAVNVALQASFDSAPYLVELLYVAHLVMAQAGNGIFSKRL
jgi:UDP-glucose:glycoprotein glucosyltransferase